MKTLTSFLAQYCIFFFHSLHPSLPIRQTLLAHRDILRCQPVKNAFEIRTSFLTNHGTIPCQSEHHSLPKSIIICQPTYHSLKILAHCCIISCNSINHSFPIMASLVANFCIILSNQNIMQARTALLTNQNWILANQTSLCLVYFGKPKLQTRAMHIWKENVSIYCRIITPGGGGGDPCVIINYPNFKH